MGKGYTISCGACGFHEIYYLGVGFAYPKVFASVMMQARRGRFGKDLKRFLKTNPKAAVDPTMVLVYCPKCHYLGREPKLTGYLPNPGYKISKVPKRMWSSAFPAYDVDYVSPSDFKAHYTVGFQYNHVCEKCNSSLVVIDESEVTQRTYLCPECGDELTVSQNIMWD